MDHFIDSNRKNWDDRVAVHVASRFYDVPGFLGGKCTLTTDDLAAVGDVQGLHLVHLQCHFGLDTLSWARRGATVTGLDFSEKAIDAAEELSQRSQLPGTFVQADVYDARSALSGEFDWVVTGVGALCWLPDIQRWAATVKSLLKPGGRLYLREAHPMLWALDETDTELKVQHPYFFHSKPFTEDTEQTYTDGPANITHTKSYTWNHSLSEVFSALLGQGLVLEHFEELRSCSWPALPQMTQREDGEWVLPEAEKDRVPLMYSVVFRQPEA